MRPCRETGAGAVTRFHDLDVLRAFAMFLGVLLHASMFLMPSKCWPVQIEYADTTAGAPVVGRRRAAGAGTTPACGWRR